MGSLVMIRKLTALMAACAVALTALAPVEAAAQRYRGGDRHYDRDYRDYRDYDRHRHYDRRRDWRRHDRDDDNDEVAAAIVGLIVGVAIGAAASQNDGRDRRYRDDRRYDPRYSRDYRDDRYGDYGYADDAYAGPPCVRRERQWDRYANRYVIVDVPC